MKQKGLGILIAALIGLGLVLVNRNDLEVKGQDNFLIRKISSSGYELQSTIRLYNPNLLSSTIQTIEEDFRINGQTVSILKMQPEQGIPGRKETAFPVMVRMDVETFNKAFPSDSIAGTEPLQASVTGTITYKNFTGGGSIPVNSSATINLE
jgi:LEA14-like dessication related protein